jgi:hypothetical protein
MCRNQSLHYLRYCPRICLRNWGNSLKFSVTGQGIRLGFEPVKSQIWHKKLINPFTGLDRPWEFQEFEARRFPDIRLVKIVRLLALRIGLYLQKVFLVLIYIRGWVDPRITVRPEGLYQPKIPSEIETATFRLVEQCLKQLRHCSVPPSPNVELSRWIS